MSKQRRTPQTDYVKWVPKPALMKRMGRWHVTMYRLTGGLLYLCGMLLMAWNVVMTVRGPGTAPAVQPATATA